MDMWAFLGAGLPSHIKDEDFDVPLPTLTSSRPSSRNSSPEANTAEPSLDEHDDLISVTEHFYHLVHRTTIVASINEAYYTTRATAQTMNNFSLSLELAKPLRARLRKWKASFTSANAGQIITEECLNPNEIKEANSSVPSENLDGNASLNLAYIVAAMTLYRALFRAVESYRPSTDGVDNAVFSAGRAAVIARAKYCGSEAVEFVEMLG